MRIGTNVSRKLMSGPGNFVRRLMDALKDLGHDVYTNDPDIFLSNIQGFGPKGSITITRLDGVWHNCEQDWQAMNRPIARNHANTPCIYQANFCKALIERYLGPTSHPTTIIRNGSQPWNGPEPTLIDPSLPKPWIIAAAQWRPHKRLYDACVYMNKGGRGTLFVLGDLKNKDSMPQSDSIVWLGKKDPDIVRAYNRQADVAISLCWIDHCPNTLVEAMCVGTPVVTTNQGGAKELVNVTSGVIIENDPPYDMKPCHLYHPPRIDLDKLDDGIIRAYKLGRIKRPDLHIKNVAKQYESFFEYVLANRRAG